MGAGDDYELAGNAVALIAAPGLDCMLVAFPRFGAHFLVEARPGEGDRSADECGIAGGFGVVVLQGAGNTPLL